MGSVVRALAPDLHDGSSSIQVRRRCVLPHSSLSAAPSTASTTHRRLYTTTSSPICYCRLPAVLITMLFVMSLFVLFNLTSILALHMLISENVMIYVLVLISKLPIFSTNWLWYSTRCALASLSGNINCIKTVNMDSRCHFVGRGEQFFLNM